MSRCYRSLVRGVLAAALLLAACSEQAPPERVSHDAYVWQRRWQAALVTALGETADLVRAWRVLAAEVDAHGRWQPIAVDLAALAATGRPAIPVVRIAAPLAALDQAALIAQLRALRNAWPQATTLEIDHDCGTRQLAAYAHFVGELRAALPAGQRLSLTVLPDWLAAPELETLLAAADESVLQLHGIGHRRRSLFDATEAQAWTRRFARRSAKPFRVALPTYGSRAGVNPSGRIAWIESEVAVADGASGGRELFANPADVADFLHWLGKQTPSRLAGVAWFRLPLAGDRRAWTPATWRAVINGRDEPVRLDGELRPGGVANRYTVVVHNRGAIDVPWPMAATIEPPCRGILAAKGYRLEEDASESVFLRSEQGLLRAGSEVSVGLAECTSASGLVVVDP